MRVDRLILAFTLSASSSWAAGEANLGMAFDREYADAMSLIRSGRELEARETLRYLRDGLDRMPAARARMACRRLLEGFERLGIPQDLRPGLARVMAGLEIAGPQAVSDFRAAMARWASGTPLKGRIEPPE